MTQQKPSSRATVFKHDEYDSDTRFAHSGLKQRLVGAVVLVSLAVIFLPMIFDRPHEQTKNLIVPIPEQPPEKVINIVLPSKPALSSVDNAHTAALDRLSDQAKSTTSGTVVSVEAIDQAAKDEVQRVEERLFENSAEKKKAASASVAVKTRVVEEGKVVEVQRTPKAETKPIENKSAQSVSLYSDKAQFAGKWMVQIGSFGDQDNAKNLSAEIKKKGFSSHLLKIESGGKTLSKVLAGPFEKESSAKSAKQSLDRFFKVNSIVVEY